MPRVSGLYLLTRETIETQQLLVSVEAALRGGAAVVQYRDKSADASLRLQQASALLALCHRHGALMIVNDDAQLALAAHADGVHLGEHDVSIANARSLLGAHAIIGVSCYDDPQRAIAAQQAGADYVAFGAFFTSGTKPLARRASLSMLRATRQTLSLPIVAIGGIDAGNAAALIEAGADALAVLGSIWDSDDITTASAALSSLFSSTGIP